MPCSDSTELTILRKRYIPPLYQLGLDNANSRYYQGFSLGHNTDQGLYEELRKYPERGRRWAGAMTAFASKIPLDPLAQGFDWASFHGGTVVDVGGGYGPVSIGLAQRFPHLHFIVQDFADVVAEGPSHMPPDLQGRISFMPYDFLDEQPVHGADIYFFRAVFHNWPDEHCVQILRNQIRALQPGARLVINEACMHAPNTLPAFLEKRRRCVSGLGTACLCFFPPCRGELTDVFFSGSLDPWI